GARPAHFDVIHVPAINARFSLRGTTKPVPFSGCFTCSRSKPRTTVADDTYGISPHHRATDGSTGLRIDAAAHAGVATMTARVWRRAPRASVRVYGLDRPSILETVLLY